MIHDPSMISKFQMLNVRQPRKYMRLCCIIIFDLAVFISFGMFLAAYGLQQVYLGPMKMLVNSFQRVGDMDAHGFYPELDTDVTYYDRQCTVEDISTKNCNDLIVTEKNSGAEAADTMMTHGAVVMKDILSADTAAELRNYLESRHAIKEELPFMEKFFDEIGRLSLGLGVSDHPIIGRALQEVGNHRVLKTTIEGILGRDPAIVEISTLTTLYRAGSQGIHTDSDYFGSSLLYSRTFLDSYTLFIALQNTTSRMGATTICPGTHLCANVDMEDICLPSGAFQASSNGQTGEDAGILLRGDGLMFNQNIWHRGPGNLDPEYPMNRVNLILSFASRQNSDEGDVRQQGMGTYYYQRWNMFGHSFKDLIHASKTMRQPWAALKALGLYKSKHDNWGLTWTTHFARQFANSMDFYDDFELAPFDTWLRECGLSRILPHVRRIDDFDWDQYITHTLETAKVYTKRVHFRIIGILLVGSFFVTAKNRSIFQSSIGHAIILHVLLCLLGLVSWTFIKRSYIGRMIESGRIHRLPFPVQDFVQLQNTTLPENIDILIGSRFDSPYMGIHGNILQYHNRRFDALVKSFTGIPKEIAITSVYDRSMQMMNGVSPRFLKQDYRSGYWTVMDEAESKDFIHRAIVIAQNPLQGVLSSVLKSFLSECRFGTLRDTVMAQKLSPLHISSLQDLIWKWQSTATMTIYEKRGKQPTKPGATRIHHNILSNYPLTTSSRTRPHKNTAHNSIFQKSHRVFARDKRSGEIMEALVKTVYKEKWCEVEFIDGKKQILEVKDMETYRPVVQGDRVEVPFDDGTWFPAEITLVHPLARYDVRYENGVVERNLSREEFRLSTEDEEG